MQKPTTIRPVRAIIFAMLGILSMLCTPTLLPAAHPINPPMGQRPSQQMKQPMGQRALQPSKQPMNQPMGPPMNQRVPKTPAGHSTVWTSLPDNAKFLMAAAYFRGHDIGCLEIAAKDKNVRAEDYLWIKNPQEDMKFVVATVNLVNKAYSQPENKDLLLPSVLDVAAMSAVYNVPEDKFIERINALRAENAPSPAYPSSPAPSGGNRSTTGPASEPTTGPATGAYGAYGQQSRQPQPFGQQNGQSRPAGQRQNMQQNMQQTGQQNMQQNMRQNMQQTGQQNMQQTTQPGQLYEQNPPNGTNGQGGDSNQENTDEFSEPDGQGGANDQYGTEAVPPSKPLNNGQTPRPLPPGPGSTLKKGPASDIYDQQARNLENNIQRMP